MVNTQALDILQKELDKANARISEMEVQLQASNARYALAVSGSNDGIWDWNRETEEVYFSPRWKEIIGYSDHELQNTIETWTSRIHPDDFERVMEANNRFYHSTDSHFDVEYRLLHKDGVYRWVLGRGTCIRDANGDPIRMAGAHTDITARKHAEQSLLASEAQKQAILDGISITLIYVDENMVIKWANRAAARSVNLSIEEMLERTCHSVWSSPSDICEGCPVVKAFRTKLPQIGMVTTPDGRIWDKRGEPVFDAQGKLVGMVEIAQDITPIIQVQRELMEAKDHSERASRIKTEFLAKMSHEIRTPLNGILGILQLLERNASNEEQEDLIRVASQSGQRLNTLLCDLLDLSRIEADRLVLNLEVIALRELVHDIHLLLQPTAGVKQLQLDMYVHPQIPEFIRGDALRIRQILMNLVGNAIKYTDTGSISVEVFPLPSISQSARILFAISDTGRGITEDKHQTIFDTFSQVDSLRDRQHHGAGLGLAIVRNLAELMNGIVTVESIPQEGSTFYVCITLPIATKEHKPKRLVQMKGRIAETEFPILIVEDEPVNRLALRKMLERYEQPLIEAKNGRIALDILRTTKCSLVIMDVQMPEMDGFSATQAIRTGQAGEQTEIPIIALTAYAMDSDREACIEAGMNDFLTKPVDMLMLEQILRTYLGTQE